MILQLLELPLIARLGIVAFTVHVAVGAEFAGTEQQPLSPKAPNFTIVVNGGLSAKEIQSKTSEVLTACRKLVGGNTNRILDAGQAYQKKFNMELVVGNYPAAEATAKARWLRDWLALWIKPGETLVLLGDERALPTWSVRIGSIRLTTDSFYSDLDADGIPDRAVTRILGTPAQMIRQLNGKQDYGRQATVLCSEDTRIHMETRAFAQALAQRGYNVAIRGARDDAALAAADFIVHFGHGDPAGIANRFGEPFVAAATMPELPREPVVFVDGCGTLPVGSPLLEAFLAHGAVAYCGSTATVQGMVPARFTNELVEHFLRLLAEHPDLTLPQALMLARANYVRGHDGLAERLRELATQGESAGNGEWATHLLTAAEWVYYGDPRATLPTVGMARMLSQPAVLLKASVRLVGAGASWKTAYTVNETDGQAILAIHARVPLNERPTFRLHVQQGEQTIAALDSHQDTVYQRLGSNCRGGYVDGDHYQARYLVPLKEGAGQQRVEVELAEGSVVELLPGTGIEVWPADFIQQIGLRLEPAAGSASRARVRLRPVNVTGEAKLQPMSIRGYLGMDLSALYNRPHGSTQLGGGDNASFKTWFVADEVMADGVPFMVRRRGNDALVSPNNTENVFEIIGLNRPARAIHLLVWGYMNPNPARLSIEFDDGSVQEADLPLSEWTRPTPPVAFDFENTVPAFRHAAITHQALPIDDPAKKIVTIKSHSGHYGLVAMTLEIDGATPADDNHR